MHFYFKAVLSKRNILQATLAILNRCIKKGRVDEISFNNMLYLVQYSQNTIIPIYNQHDNVNEICYILFITLSLSNLVCTLTLTAHLNPVTF